MIKKGSSSHKTGCEERLPNAQHHDMVGFLTVSLTKGAQTDHYIHFLKTVLGAAQTERVFEFQSTVLLLLLLLFSAF